MSTGSGALRIGLIGYGFAGRVFHAPVIASADSLALVAVVTSRADEVRRDLPGVTVISAPDALLADPAVDLVVVATPNTTHRELVARVLAAGKHVVVEKPFVTRAEDAGPLIELAVKKGVVLSVYHNRRWDGDFLTIRSLVEEGSLGDVALFESHFDRYRPGIKEGWREEPLEGSGILYDLGSHLVDQALVLFGMPDAVWADVATQREASRVHDYFHLVLSWGACRAILHGGMLVPDPGPRFAVHGTTGSFTTWGLDPQEARLIAGEPDPFGPPAPGRPARLATGSGSGVDVVEMQVPSGRYPTYYEGVAAAIRGDGPNPVPASEARDVIRVIEAALRSSATGRRVDLR